MSNIFESIKNGVSEIEKDFFETKEKLDKYEAKNTIVGYIYILINPGLKDFEHRIKIGYSNDVARRMKDRDIAGAGNPDPWHCYAWYAVTDKNLDKKLHSMIDFLNPNLRYINNREFYIMTKEEAYELLEGIATLSGTMDRLVKNPLNDDYFKDNDANDVSKAPEDGNINNIDIIVKKHREENNIKIFADNRNSYEAIEIPEGYYYSPKKTSVAYVDNDGNWIILKGSHATTRMVNASPKKNEKYYDRWNYIKDETFTENVNLGKVKPSGAATFVENRPISGWDEYWFTEDGIRLGTAFPRAKKNK